MECYDTYKLAANHFPLFETLKLKTIQPIGTHFTYLIQIMYVWRCPGLAKTNVDQKFAIKEIDRHRF